MTSARALQLRVQYPPAPKRDGAPMAALTKARRVERWADFPKETQSRYMQIAACFPGVQVYACGSRVKGYYADEGDEAAHHARALIGRRHKVSDWDYIVPRGTQPVQELPAWADLCGDPPDARHTIPIPIA